jgi:hypothetical protein
MSRKLFVLLITMLAAAGVVFLTPVSSSAARESSDKTPWRIEGQLEEACSCSAACPCWFGSKPTKMTCGGGQFLFIQRGSYGKVPLDGLAVGNMGQSPEGKGMMESFGKWNFSYLYIDEKANPEQRAALKVIGSTVLALAASTKQEIRYTPIVRSEEGKEHKISLGQYGRFSGHLMEGGLGGAVRIINPPGADPLHREYQQGETTSMTYNDAEQNWHLQGTNYMYATFELDSAMYEKYMAGLSQKMQAQKK